jgi:hypothetical protein
MEAAISMAPPKRKSRRILLRVTLVLVAILVASQLAWTFSGSKEWEFLGERNGVNVYSMKVPGDNVKQFKATMRSRSRLSVMTAVMQDFEIAEEAGYIAPVMIERKSPQQFTSSMRAEMPFFFKTRELVTRVDISQDQQSKEVLVTVKAVPEAVPPDDCCVRVENMDNSWRFIPVGNGEVEMEWKVNMDQGGFVPYFLINAVFPEFMYEVPPMMQEIMNREQYQNVKFDFIQDLPTGG